MPETAVRNAIAGYGSRLSGMAREEIAIDVAKTFEITVTAARVRLEGLKLIEPVEKKPVKVQADEPEIVKKMRERRREREADDAIFNRRDEDLWNNVERGHIRRKKRR